MSDLEGVEGAHIATTTTERLVYMANQISRFFAPQPHDSAFGAGAGEVFAVAVAAPPSLPSTSATTSRIKFSFTALIGIYR